jgi:hypothetical protein
MTNFGTFTFKNGLLIVKSRVFNAQGFANEFGCDLKNGKVVVGADENYTIFRDVLLQAGYEFV